MERFQIESRVGRGAQHVVGRLADGSLIKYPHSKGALWDASTTATVRRDLDIHRLLGTPVPEARVSNEPELDDGRRLIKPPYAIIVDEIEGEVFREADLENDGIREQITAITMKSLEIREKIGAGIDFLGGAAFKNFLAYLALERQPGQLGAYNIIVDARDKIWLIDTNLLDPKRAPAGMEWVIGGLIDLQNGLMTNVLRDEDIRQKYLDGAPYRPVAALADGMYGYSRKLERRRASLLPQASTAP